MHHLHFEFWQIFLIVWRQVVSPTNKNCHKWKWLPAQMWVCSVNINPTHSRMDELHKLHYRKYIWGIWSSRNWDNELSGRSLCCQLEHRNKSILCSPGMYCQQKQILWHADREILRLLMQETCSEWNLENKQELQPTGETENQLKVRKLDVYFYWNTSDTHPSVNSGIIWTRLKHDPHTSGFLGP